MLQRNEEIGCLNLGLVATQHLPSGEVPYALQRGTTSEVVHNGPSGYRNHSVTGFTNHSKRGTKSKVLHMWGS